MYCTCENNKRVPQFWYRHSNEWIHNIFMAPSLCASRRQIKICQIDRQIIHSQSVISSSFHQGEGTIRCFKQWQGISICAVYYDYLRINVEINEPLIWCWWWAVWCVIGGSVKQTLSRSQTPDLDTHCHPALSADLHGLQDRAPHPRGLLALGALFVTSQNIIATFPIV